MAATKLWQLVAPDHYQRLRILYSPRTSVLTLHRPLARRILAARSTHSDFKAYHTCFRYDDALIHYSCSKYKSPLHLFFCRKGKAKKTLTHQPIFKAIPWLLRTSAGIHRLADWISATKFYKEICLARSRNPPEMEQEG
jgi:hypothetical protein